MTEAVFYNAINLAHGGDYRKILKVKNQCGNWEEAWKKLPNPRRVDPEKEWAELEKSGIRLLLQNDLLYPELLKEIPQAPFGIYVLGNLPSNEHTRLAIVGTRKATYEGKNLARRFAGELAERDFVIVSGLALGLDAVAHEGCLEARGKTLAVLANGLDRIYPRTNERLAKRIIENGGAILSEYPLGTESFPYRFLERNRIVSGLSRGTLVIEAPKHSGSLVTARLALEQNRDVFVIPGPINHPNFYGSNQLIRAGAELVTKPEEILEAYGIEIDKETDRAMLLETEEERKIVEALRTCAEAADVDKLAELTNLSISIVNRALTFLIMKNVAKETGEGYVLI